MLPRRAGIVAWCAIAALAALVCLFTVAYAFPRGTTDLDEVAYESQARTLREGHLTLPAATHVPYFRPFLTGVRDDRVVFKYQPEWPALIALSEGLTGSSLPLRAAMAAMGVLVVGWLAWEVTREERVALLAAALALLSPFTWVQSASLLGYELTFVLGTAAVAATVRAFRVQRARVSVLAGACVGLAILHRPFDGLLVAVPAAAFAAWTIRRDRAGLRMLGPGIAGLLPPAALLLAYDAAVMGSPLRLPFGVTGGHDRFLFGWRSSFLVAGTGHAYEIHYTLGRAFSTLGHDLVLFPKFLAIAPVTLVFAALAMWRHRRDPRCVLLVALVAVTIGGYFFWWATANAELFGIDRSLGPFYDYFAVAPVCVLAAWGIAHARPRRWQVVALVAFAGVWTAGASWRVLSAARGQGQARSVAVLETEPPSSRAALVLVPPRLPGDPYLEFATDAHLGARRLVALDVPGRRLDLLGRFGGRAAFLVREYRPFGDPFGPTRRDRVAVRVVRGAAVTFDLHATLDANQPATAYLRIGTGRALLSPRGRGRGRGRVAASWRLDAADLAPGRSTSIAVGVALGRSAAGPSAAAAWYECRFDARAAAPDLVEVLSPCDGWDHYVFPNGATALSREDLSGVLTASVH